MARPPRLSRTAVATTLAVVASAAVGSVGADSGAGWYQRLRKPAWQPPAAAFPIGWTGLYAAIAVSGATALAHATPPERRRLARALGANLVLNTGWTWLFFTARQLGPATAECAVLTLSSADLAQRAAAVDSRTAYGLVPYAAWCGFATTLSGKLWALNR